ncbi:MAG: phosphoenolpyruvate--protein phosphotransferase [Treponema sp.]|nr:phosphoenolpyruvate--protein phosphotransferase [Treponema sp.]
MELQGKGAAPGVAVGRVYVYNKKISIPAERFISAGEEQSHLNRYLSVKEQALEELEKIKVSMSKVDPSKAEIFGAQKEIIEDIIINEEIPAKIKNERWAGDWAIYTVYETVLSVLRKTADSLIAERSSDFEDVRALLLRFWNNETTTGLSDLAEPVIIAAEDLLPSDIGAIGDKKNILAILLEKGGITSHTAIIAKSCGIPAVVCVSQLLEHVKNSQLAAVNADEGKIILDPDNAIVGDYNKKKEIFLNEKKETAAFLKNDGCTACGVKIDIGLNISSADASELGASEYTDSVGVFRTEFIYMGRSTLPTEEEQFLIYKKTLESYGDRPVVLRTLDIGGDKKLESTELPREDNPFLGNRALRFCFSRPDIFKTQIRATLRASVFGNLWLMLPMVGSLDDIRKAKEFITLTKKELKKENKPFKEIKIGIMIEIPAIAYIADLAAKEVDFASIGSNDLIQYLCAADRMNSAVEEYYQSFHPSMLRLIKETIAAFDSAGKPISICGEMGSDPLAIPVLLGLGMRKLSMGSASVAAVKRVLAGLTIVQCEELAAGALQLSTADEIKEFLNNKCSTGHTPRH